MFGEDTETGWLECCMSDPQFDQPPFPKRGGDVAKKDPATELALLATGIKRATTRARAIMKKLYPIGSQVEFWEFSRKHKKPGRVINYSDYKGIPALIVEVDDPGHMRPVAKVTYDKLTS